MKTIDRLRELATAGTSPQWDREIRNALPAMLEVVEAQAAEIAAWRAAEEECRAIENACDMNAARAYIARSRDNTDDALRKLDEVTP